MKRLTLAALLVLLGACGPKNPSTGGDPLAGVRVIVPKPVKWTAGQPRDRGVCQSGCAYIPGPGIPQEQVDRLIGKIAATPVGEDTPALDELLFHDDDARARLAAGPVPLSPQWEAFLRQELARRDAFFALKVVDDKGQVRAEVPESRMTLGVKRHFETLNNVLVNPLDANGTLVRVGLDHIWYRF